MWLFSTILFGVLLIINGLKNCDDCVIYSECPQSNDLLKHKNSEVRELFKSSACRTKPLSVCCSDLLSFRYGIFGIDEKTNRKQKVENHPNVKLLPEICGEMEMDRIIGGESVSLYDFPWMALIQYKKGRGLFFNCGGTVINKKYVLTAAHCIKNETVSLVRIGEYNISSTLDCVGLGRTRQCENNTHQDISVEKIIVHPDYKAARGHAMASHDIGLLRLSSEVNFSRKNAGAICLPIFQNVLEESLEKLENGVIAGWGATKHAQSSDVLLKASVTIYSTQSCDAYYSLRKLDNVICAGDEHTDSCKGDSGGPLMITDFDQEFTRQIQLGIVSQGYDCGTRKPGLYTDVRKYMKWILDNIKE